MTAVVASSDADMLLSTPSRWLAVDAIPFPKMVMGADDRAVLLLLR